MIVDLSGYGTCAKSADVEEHDGVVTRFRINGGCPGSSAALAALVEGSTVMHAYETLKDIRCKGHLSCAAAAANALLKGE